MSHNRTSHYLLNALTYLLAFLLFFPILWMVLTSFKLEADAVSIPPKLLFTPTLDNWNIALFDQPYMEHLVNTAVITLFATFGALLLGVPAAYSLAFYQTKRSNSTLMWVISTRMLPPVGVILPLYIIFRDLHWLDTHFGLIVIYIAVNLPLVIWMMRSFLLDLPYEVLEAARVDGVNYWQEMRLIVLPLILPGLMATMLLTIIFVWNEFFFAFNLTAKNAAPLSVYISSFKTSEGLFWAKMSAAATATVLPIVIAGWFAQRHLVRGLTLGAVKG